MTTPDKAPQAPAPTPSPNEKATKPKAANTLPTGTANSSSADPDARHRPLDAPVGQVTRHT